MIKNNNVQMYSLCLSYHFQNNDAGFFPVACKDKTNSSEFIEVVRKLNVKSKCFQCLTV